MNGNNNEQKSSIHDSNHHCPHKDDIDMNLVIAKQLFEAYCKFTYTNEDVSDMATILSSTLSPTTSSPISNTTIPSIISSFIELRSQYIGNIDVSTTNNDEDNNNTITNRFSTDNVVFNYSLFRAALLTDSPIIIDAIMPYINNYDFTTLDIPHDQVDLIQKINIIYNETDEIYPTNYILQAIIDTAKSGHYKSIQHLINNYQLSPTIPIWDAVWSEPSGSTNLLSYAAQSNNLQLIEYLLPLCIKSTNQKVMPRLIFNITEYGHLHLIKQLRNEYNINITQLVDPFNQNVLYYAVQSNNIELIDYLIEDLNVSVNSTNVLHSAIDSRKWDNVKHLITKHNINISFPPDVLRSAVQDPNLTPDIIDDLMTIFNVTPVESNQGSLLYSLASNCNVMVIKHLIAKYGANPHSINQGNNCDKDDGDNDSLLHAALNFPYHIKSPQLFEMVKYLLCELGLDINGEGSEEQTPIELLVESECKPNEDRFSIFKLLLEHKAIIRDVEQFFDDALENNHISILQYLIETYQPSIDINKLNLLNTAVKSRPSSEFVTYLLSLNVIDINKQDKGRTAIRSAMISTHLSVDVIKLLVENGAKVTIEDWFVLFGYLAYRCNPYQLFQCLDYFKDTFGWDIATFSSQDSQPVTSLLSQFSCNQLKFRYSMIKNDKNQMNYTIIYRALIHHYKASVNEQDLKNNNNTVFHNLATYNHYELIEFTLLHSHYKPNIYLVNKKGQTFLHTLVSNYDQWAVDKNDDLARGRRQQSILSRLNGTRPDYDSPQFILSDDEVNDKSNYFEKVIDFIFDLL